MLAVSIPELVEELEPTEEELADETELSEEELALERAREERVAELRRIQEERARERQAKVRATFFHGSAGLMGVLAGITGRVNWTSVGAAVDRAISSALYGALRGLLFLFRAVGPGEPQEESLERNRPNPKMQTAWKLAAFVVPILLIVAGVAMWGFYRAEQRAAFEKKITQLVSDSTKELDNAKRLGASDRVAARESAQKAVSFAEQARTASPSDQRTSNAYYQARDYLDTISGIAVLNAAPFFAVFSDARAKPTRIVVHWPDVYILDRGANRVYHYLVNDIGSTATPTPRHGIILKTGDKVDKRSDDRAENRTVGELLDLMWIDSGRLVALDRNGTYFQYDPARAAWTWRAVNDPIAWGRATLAATYANNLYVMDASRNQILRYATSSQDSAAWSSSTTYFAPSLNPPELTTVVDMAVDGEVWLARADGSLLRYTSGRSNDLALSGLDVPIVRSAAIFTSDKINNVYIADAGNQRIVQFDKTTGKFSRQFKPGGVAVMSFMKSVSFFNL